MQNITFDMIGIKAPLIALNSEDIRLRLSDIGYLDPSLILKTDNTVNVNINKNVYTISTNLHIITEEYIVSPISTITLLKENFGILEVLVNLELTNENPAYGEIIDYTTFDNTITFNSNEYIGKIAHIKYLSTK